MTQEHRDNSTSEIHFGEKESSLNDEIGFGEKLIVKKNSAFAFSGKWLTPDYCNWWAALWWFFIPKIFFWLAKNYLFLLIGGFLLQKVKHKSNSLTMFTTTRIKMNFNMVDFQWILLNDTGMKPPLDLFNFSLSK